MIVEDFKACTDSGNGGEAVWEYVVNTLEPVVRESLISEDNYFYLLCLQGMYSTR